MVAGLLVNRSLVAVKDREGRWQVNDQETRGSIISSLERYIQECEAEAQSDLVHRKNVQLLADYLYKKDMKSILVFESIVVAVFLTIGLLLLWHIQSFQSTPGVCIGFIFAVVCMSLLMLFPFIKELFHLGGTKRAVRALQLTFLVLLLAIIGWAIPYARRPILIIIIYGVVLGCAIVVIKVIGLFMLYFQPMAEITGEIMIPKFFREAIMYRENSPENGRLDTQESLESCMRYLRIPQQDIGQILLISEEYNPTNLAEYSEVPSILLDAVKQDASGDELVAMIQKTQSKNMNHMDEFGRSYLECVIKFTGNRAYCRSLLHAGADPNAISSDFQGTLFHIAIQKGMLDLSLMEEFLKLITPAMDLWASPLWYFAKYKQVDVSKEEEQAMARLLIKHGYNINEVDFQSEETVLQTAARYNPYLCEVIREG